MSVTDESRARLDLARRLARKAGEEALRWYQSPRLTTERKSDGSVVTPVDRSNERLIREGIASKFPDDGVLGEEFGDTPGGNAWRWVIDPIDGTGSFVRGLPHFCTLIGIEHDDHPTAGVAEFPALGESIHAALGSGAWWRTRGGDERPARATGIEHLGEALMEIGAPRSFDAEDAAERRRRIQDAARRVRGWSDGHAFALVATGRVDGAVQVNLHRWDVSAFVPILAEAGADFTDWSGGDASNGGSVVAAGPALHATLITALRAER